MPGAFSAGANLADVAAAVKDGQFDAIDKMIAGLQYGLLNLRHAPFPVVAAPFGLTLGGGCELCLGALTPRPIWVWLRSVSDCCRPGAAV